jgi:sarcosine oxidase subunit beta
MACAYEIARQDETKRVVVFDKQGLGNGTTGGSAGVICPVELGEIYALMNVVGYGRIRELARDHGLRFTQWGQLDLIYEPRTFPPPPNRYASLFDSRDRDGFYVTEVLEQKDVLRRYPWLRAEAMSADGPRRLLGGVLYPTRGFINPYELVALYQELVAATGRVDVYPGTPVLELRQSGGRIQRLVTRRGPWDVGQVVNTAGPWGRKVAALAGSDMALTPQRIQVCVATAFDDGVDQYPLGGIGESVQGQGVWCRGELGGTLLFGQHHHVTRPGIVDDPDHVNRLNDDDYPDAVARTYRRYLDLPKSTFHNGWCCVYGTTQDGYPIICRDVAVENLYHALGMNGHGIVMHASVGMSVAELVLRDSPRTDLSGALDAPFTLDVSRLDMDRFRRNELLDFDIHLADLAEMTNGQREVAGT